MNLSENIKMAVKTLMANRLRSTLTVLGIVIGNASVVAMIGIGQGAQTYTQEKVESLGANLLYVFIGPQDTEGGSGEMAKLLLSNADAIAAQAPDVKIVSPIISSNLQLSYRSRTSKAMVQGVTPGFLQARNMSMSSGRFWDEAAQHRNDRVVVLGASLAEKFFDRSNPIGQEIQIGNLTFQVIGVLQRRGAFLGVNPEAEAHIPITTMANQVSGRRVPGGVAIDQMEVSANGRSRIRAAAFQVTNILTRLRGKQDFSVIANKTVQDLLLQITVVLSILLSAIASVSLVVGGIGIMNIMLVSVKERTQEIGLRKALGAPEQSILQQFLIEAVILSTAGGIIGISLGVSITLLIGVFTPLKPSVPISAIVLATGVSGGIGLIFGVIPARQAAKLDPVVALRST